MIHLSDRFCLSRAVPDKTYSSLKLKSSVDRLLLKQHENTSYQRETREFNQVRLPSILHSHFPFYHELILRVQNLSAEDEKQAGISWTGEINLRLVTVRARLSSRAKLLQHTYASDRNHFHTEEEIKTKKNKRPIKCPRTKS